MSIEDRRQPGELERAAAAPASWLAFGELVNAARRGRRSSARRRSCRRGKRISMLPSSTSTVVQRREPSSWLHPLSAEVAERRQLSQRARERLRSRRRAAAGSARPTPSATRRDRASSAVCVARSAARASSRSSRARSGLEPTPQRPRACGPPGSRAVDHRRRWQRPSPLAAGATVAATSGRACRVVDRRSGSWSSVAATLLEQVSSPASRQRRRRPAARTRHHLLERRRGVGSARASSSSRDLEGRARVLRRRDAAESASHGVGPVAKPGRHRARPIRAAGPRCASSGVQRRRAVDRAGARCGSAPSGSPSSRLCSLEHDSSHGVACAVQRLVAARTVAPRRHDGAAARRELAAAIVARTCVERADRLGDLPSRPTPPWRSRTRSSRPTGRGGRGRRRSRRASRRRRGPSCRAPPGGDQVGDRLALAGARRALDDEVWPPSDRVDRVVLARGRRRGRGTRRPGGVVGQRRFDAGRRSRAPRCASSVAGDARRSRSCPVERLDGPSRSRDHRQLGVGEVADDHPPRDGEPAAPRDNARSAVARRRRGRRVRRAARRRWR